MIKKQNFFLTTWIKFIVRYNIKSENDINKQKIDAANEQIKEMLTQSSIFDNSCQPKQLQLKQIETFRQKFVYQKMLQTSNYLNTTGNKSNIILKTYGSPVTRW